MGRAFEYRRASKEKRWDKMSKIFPKLGKAITMAAKEGGMDPSTNAKLRTAIQNAKSENMPKDNIDAAIKRAEQKDLASFTEVNYEGKGPHGVLVYVECASDNPTRTVANVKSYFNKAGGAVVPNGSMEFMFARKSVFEIVKTDEIDPETLELELIDAGGGFRRARPAARLRPLQRGQAGGSDRRQCGQPGAIAGQGPSGVHHRPGAGHVALSGRGVADGPGA